jgi:hypothetical protein
MVFQFKFFHVFRIVFSGRVFEHEASIFRSNTVYIQSANIMIRSSDIAFGVRILTIDAFGVIAMAMIVQKINSLLKRRSDWAGLILREQESS